MDLARPSDGAPAPARQFARLSAIASLGLGAAGQIACYLMIPVTDRPMSRKR